MKPFDVDRLIEIITDAVAREAGPR
jgi:hypothetical protein